MEIADTCAANTYLLYRTAWSATGRAFSSFVTRSKQISCIICPYRSSLIDTSTGITTMRNRCSSALLLLAVALLMPVWAHGVILPKPRLVVFITVDQLRGDMPFRFADRFGAGGFRYLLEEGTVYHNAHYRHANTFTAVGHATLATGGNSPQHGIVGNEWYNKDTKVAVYCVEDSNSPVLGAAAGETGYSPRNLTSSTFGDELVLATAGASRVFSVSMKDRSAILLGGHRGKAFWFDETSGHFVTSGHYYADYPAWVAAWNSEGRANAWVGTSWSLLHALETYVYRGQDDRVEERGYKGLGRLFPHPLPAEAGKDYYGTLRFTPMGDALTLAFAHQLIVAESLGGGEETDVLMLSLSATDYIGHAYGPNSLEAEDNLLQLDQNLAEFLARVDGLVGLDRTLVVLSSDHGVDAIPEYTQHMGCDGGRHYPEHFMADMNGALRARFGVEEDLVVTFKNPSFYLDEGRITALGLNLAEVEQVLATALVNLPGFDNAITRTDLMTGNVPDTTRMDQVRRAFHPKRSGNVLVVQSPSWYLYPDAEKYAAMHGSPHSYDTFVPIMFAGPCIPARQSFRAVAPEDVASTITSYLGIKPPTGNMGSPLVEILE